MLVTIEIADKEGVKQIDIDQYPVIIGRAAAADIVISNSILSRKHLAIRNYDNALWVIDLNSVNGTWLNGEKLTPSEPKKINNGDTIFFSHDEKIQIRFHLKEKAIENLNNQEVTRVSGDSVLLTNSGLLSQKNKDETNTRQPSHLIIVEESEGETSDDMLNKIAVNVLPDIPVVESNNFGSSAVEAPVNADELLKQDTSIHPRQLPIEISVTESAVVNNNLNQIIPNEPRLQIMPASEDSILATGEDSIGKTSPFDNEQNVVEEIMRLMRSKSQTLVRDAEREAQILKNEADEYLAQKKIEAEEFLCQQTSLLHIEEEKLKKYEQQLQTKASDTEARLANILEHERRVVAETEAMRERANRERADLLAERKILETAQKTLSERERELDRAELALKENEKDAADRINTKLVDAEAVISKLESEQKALAESIKTETEDHKKITAQHEERIKELNHEYQDLNRRKTLLMSEHARISEQGRSLQQQVKELTRQKDLLGTQLQTTQEDFESISKQSAAILRDKDFAEQSLSRALEELRQVNQKIQHRENEAKSILDQAMSSSKDIISNSQLKAGSIIDSAQTRADEIIRKSEAQIESLRNQIADTKQQLDEIEEERDARLRDCNQKVTELIDQATEKAKTIISDAEAKASSTRQSAKNESEQMLSKLREEVLRRQDELAKLTTFAAEQKLMLEQELARERAKSKEETDRLALRLLEDKDKFEKDCAQRTLALEQERIAIIAKANAEVADLKACSVKEIESESEKSKEALQLELKKLKQEQEAKLAQHYQLELAKAKDLKAQYLKEFESDKNKKVTSISTSIYAATYSELLKLKGKSVSGEQITEVAHKIKLISSDVLLDRPIDDSDSLQKILKTSVNGKEKEHRFWRRLAIYASATVTLTAIIILFPEIYNAPSRAISALFAPKPSAISDSLVQEQMREVRERMTYRPEETPDFKGSYVDNVIFTTGYIDQKNQKEFQDKWILAVNDYFINVADVKDTTIIKFVSLESGLIGDLSKLRWQIDPKNPQLKIDEMRKREEEFKTKLSEIMGGHEKVDDYYQFAANFWTSHVK